MKKEFGFHTNIILNTMCMVVGADYNNINMKEDNWYFKHMWSEETEKEFKKWFVDYLHKIKPAQRELYDRSYMKKIDCEKAVDMWMLNYGWCHNQPQWYLDEQGAKEKI